MKLWQPNCMMGFRTPQQAREHFRVQLGGTFWDAAHVGELFGGPVSHVDVDGRKPYENPPCTWWLESLMDCPTGPVGKCGRCLSVSVQPCEVVLPGDIVLDVAAWFMRADLCNWHEDERPVVQVDGVIALVERECPSGVWWNRVEAPPFVPNR